MTRLLVVACVVGSIVGAGCSKSKDTAAGSAAPTGSASAAHVDTAAVDQLVNDMMAYTDKMLPAMIAFDGDCAAQAQRMLELEPLAQKIRAEGTALESDAASQAALKAAMAGRRDEVMARMKAKLGAAHTTEDAVNKKEQELKDKCGNDPAFQAAMNRVGLRKKKS
jgi:hypothetical protein